MRPLTSALLLGAMLAGALFLGGMLAGPVALAQYPDATAAPAPVAGPVDPRSSGEGPGLQAEPLVVLVGVILLGLLATGGTLLYVRITRDD
jgi:hypothetical protein